MKLRKIDPLLAETRHVSVDYGRTLGGYRIIQCPFCFTQSSIYAEELKARMEAEDAKYMACAQPKRTIVRRVVGEWEDA